MPQMSFPGVHSGCFQWLGPARPAWLRAWPRSAGPRSVPASLARRGITAPQWRRPFGTRHAQRRSAIPDVACKVCHHRGLATWGITPLRALGGHPPLRCLGNRRAGTVRDRPRPDIHAVQGPNTRRRAHEDRGRTTSEDRLPSVTHAPRRDSGRTGSPTTRHAGGQYFTVLLVLSTPGTRPNARKRTQTHPATYRPPFGPRQPPTDALRRA
jgi:hypothetical protein